MITRTECLEIMRDIGVSQIAEIVRSGEPEDRARALRHLELIARCGLDAMLEVAVRRFVAGGTEEE